jgi:anti-sigma B factor antagonist
MGRSPLGLGLSQPQERSLSSFTTPSPPFTVEHREAGHRTVVAVSGEVDIASSPALRSALDDALDADDLCVDLSETTFMDSSGLHVLLDVHRRMEARLTIVCPPGNVRRVLDLTGVAQSLRVFDA